LKFVVDDGPTGLAVRKSVVKSRQCNGKGDVEKSSRKMTIIVRLTSKLLRELRHLHFYPRHVGRYSLRKVLGKKIC
jgi:hypothetical protein